MLDSNIKTHPAIVGWTLGLPVAAFGSSCNLGLSFVGSAGSESWRGEFNGSGHICVNPL